MEIVVRVPRPRCRRAGRRPSERFAPVECGLLHHERPVPASRAVRCERSSVMAWTPRVHSPEESRLCCSRSGSTALSAGAGRRCCGSLRRRAALVALVASVTMACLTVMHGEQLFFVDGPFGLLAKLRMRKAKFGQRDRRPPYIGIGNRLVALARRQHVEPRQITRVIAHQERFDGCAIDGRTSAQYRMRSKNRPFRCSFR